MPFERLGDLQRILVVRLDNIGDLIMLSPALKALRAAYPKASITLMVSPGGAEAADLLPWIDTIFPWKASWQEIGQNFPGTIEQEFGLIDEIRSKAFDAAFIFTSFSQSPYPPAYISYLAGVKARIGQSKEFGGKLLTHWVKPLPDAEYQVDRNLHLLSSIGIPVTDSPMEIRIPEQDARSANELLSQAGLERDEAFFLLAPGASAAARRYPVERFAEIAAHLAASTGEKIVVIGSSRETHLAEPFHSAADTHPGILPLFGKTSIGEYAAIVARSSLVLSNNSASMHLGEALQRPMAIFYSGTDLLSQWAPRNTPVLILNRTVSCSPCYAFQCPYHLECLEISPDEAVGHILAFLKQLDSRTYQKQMSPLSMEELK
jgi:ADP-heptose:LPS heptosyltransferase